MLDSLEAKMLAIQHEVHPHEMEMFSRIVSGNALPEDYIQVGRLTLFNIFTPDQYGHYQQFKTRATVAYVSPGVLAYARASITIMNCYCGAHTSYFSFAKQTFLEDHYKCVGKTSTFNST